MELARIILVADGQAYALVRPKWLTATFVTGDVISFALQGMGNVPRSKKSPKHNRNTEH